VEIVERLGLSHLVGVYSGTATKSYHPGTRGAIQVEPANGLGKYASTPLPPPLRPVAPVPAPQWAAARMRPRRPPAACGWIAAPQWSSRS